MFLFCVSAVTVTAASVLVAGLCRGCHREEKSARSGERGHRGTATKIQGDVLQFCVSLIISVGSVPCSPSSRTAVVNACLQGNRRL